MEDLEIKSSLKVSKLLSQFLENEVLNKLNLNVNKFWEDFDHVIKVFAPKNENLLSFLILSDLVTMKFGFYSSRAFK